MCTNYSPAKVERWRVLLGLGPPLDYAPETGARKKWWFACAQANGRSRPRLCGNAH